MKRRLFRWWLGERPVYCVPKTWWPSHWHRCEQITKYLDYIWRIEQMDYRIHEAIVHAMRTGEIKPLSAFQPRDERIH